jgi:hypothetical protein
LRERGEKMWAEFEDRLERLEDSKEDRSSGLAGLVTFAAGIAATYFLTSDKAAPTRAKVRDAATELRRRATDRWDRLQERRHTNGVSAERSPQAEQAGGPADL